MQGGFEKSFRVIWYALILFDYFNCKKKKKKLQLNLSSPSGIVDALDGVQSQIMAMQIAYQRRLKFFACLDVVKRSTRWRNAIDEWLSQPKGWLEKGRMSQRFLKESFLSSFFFH